MFQPLKPKKKNVRQGAKHVEQNAKENVRQEQKNAKSRRLSVPNRKEIRTGLKQRRISVGKKSPIFGRPISLIKLRMALERI